MRVTPDHWGRSGRNFALVVAIAVALSLMWMRSPMAASDQIALNFKDADIDSVVGAFGHLLDRTFIIDPRVRGKITLETPKPVGRDQAYQLLQSTLRMQGFAIVDNGIVAKVVPEADAKLQSGPVTAAKGPSRGGDQVVTQIFRLQYESATNLVAVLRPLISPNNTITAYSNNNSLVITDYAANLERISRIVSTLDSPATNEVEVIPVRHALATDIAVTVARMLDDASRAGGGAQVDAGQRVAVLADPRINSIMIRATSPAKINLARTLISRLDQPATTPGNINVVYLRNAEAVRLVQVLRSVLAGGDGSSGSSATGTGTTATGAGLAQQTPGGGVQGALTNTPANTPLQGNTTGNAPVTVNAGGAVIAADPATNSLIITAPEPIYRNLRAVIDRLDARRAQVYIETLIVEISSNRAAELGIQWQALGAPQGSTRVIGGTNLPARGSGGNIVDAAANLSSLGTGLNLGVVRGTVTIPGVGEVLNLGLLARALETTSNGNILATPNLLTLDNEEARIIIGQNVPFITGQFTLAGSGSGTTNPFQTIERKDVGTTLRVKPQVSEGGTIKLQIFQEVSAVQDTTLAAGLITSRRAIESSVLVDDGQIVVLGGLIQETVQGNVSQVPGLGDIPVLGQLFRYDSRSRVKTNLLVFLRPIIIRDANAAFGVTSDRYDYIRGVQGNSQLPNHWLLPNYPAGELPGMPKPGDPSGKANPNSAPGPASMAPEVAESAKRGASARGGVIQTAPNEVIIPVNIQTSETTSGPAASPEPAREVPRAPVGRIPPGG